jgi:localization factor PodJL
MREALADARRAEDELNQAMFGASLDLETSPKEDYLTTARRAAQANAQASKKSALRLPQPEAGAEPAAGLRGLSRIVLWGAAGVMAAAVAGGVYVYSNTKPRQGDFPAQPHKSASLTAPPGSIAEGAALAAQEEAAALSGEEAAVIPGAEQPVRAGPLDLQAEGSGATVQPMSARVGTIEEAAAQGDSVAQYELALARLANGDTAHAAPLLRRAANQGLAMAQYRLAKLYERGEGVPLDLTEARRWTERAAVAGNRKAMHDLGVYYARGEGAPFDEGQAFKWFRQAAEYGVGDSQFNLGVLYTQGRGVTADSAEALYWFSIAAGGGDADARARAAMIEQKMDATTLARVKDRIAAFKVKPGIARANGDFGPRPWAGGARSVEASTQGAPRS